MKVTKLLLCASCLLYVTLGVTFAEEENDTKETSNDNNNSTRKSEKGDIEELETEETSPRSRRSGAQDNENEESKGRSYGYDDSLKYKRSGDIFGAVKSKIKPKIGSLLSVSSPGHHGHYEPPVDYGPPLHYGHKSFNIWGFKKAIFGAIVQAVKAITGGVLALKGQLIKVKGHLVETKGKILQTKGEAISHFGRHVATKALLNPPHVPASASSSGFSSSGFGHSSSHPGQAPGYEPSVSQGHGFGGSGVSYGPPQGGVGPVSLPPSSPGGNYGPPPPSGGGSIWGSAPSPPAPFSHAYGPPPQQAPLPAPAPGYGAPFPAPANEYGPPQGGFGKPIAEYGPPYKRDALGAPSSIPQGVHAGLLVLKPFNKMPSSIPYPQNHHAVPQNHPLIKPHRRSMDFSDDEYVEVDQKHNNEDTVV